jgi:peptidoglycan/xylan/chitin deacetylase (PgdA/CDA1 family)
MIDPVTRFLHRSAGQHGPAMLMYHSITLGRIKPAWPWALSMQQFRDHLDFIVAEGYSTPTMGELVAAPAKKWIGRTLVITFDDGYVDNLAACEELKKRGLRASWFVVTGAIGQFPKWPADGRPEGRLLNAAELREMQSGGMEVGSHTVSHTRLTEADDAQLSRELVESKATLEDKLGGAINSFAYPFGAWDVRCENAVKQAGYVAACTTRTGWALRDNDPYRLRRLTIFNNDSVSLLARKLSFGSHDVNCRYIARHALRRLRLV